MYNPKPSLSRLYSPYKANSNPTATRSHSQPVHQNPKSNPKNKNPKK